jgi:hypothetical protein
MHVTTLYSIVSCYSTLRYRHEQEKAVVEEEEKEEMEEKK